MRSFNYFAMLFVAIALLFSSCGASDTVKGTGIGAGAGAALGAGLGAIFGGGKGALIGAGAGAALGAGGGAIIGNKMEKQKKELERIEAAKVESTDEGRALKVTFDSGILFQTNGYTLNANSRSSLNQLAASLISNPDTDIVIQGYTDNTGSDAINNPLSENRAKSVYSYLVQDGVSPNRMTYYGLGSSDPVASNATSAGRAENRRVEIFILPNAKMIQEANQGK